MGVRWEYFVEILRAAGVDSVRLLAWEISKVNADSVLRHLGRLELEVRGGMEPVEQTLDGLRAALDSEPPGPPQMTPAEPQPPSEWPCKPEMGCAFSASTKWPR